VIVDLLDSPKKRYNHPLSYLYGTARNRINDYFRQSNRNRELEADRIPIPERPDELEMMALVEEADKLIGVIEEEMSDNYSSVLLYRLYRGLTVKETVEITGFKKSTVKSYLTRARKDLIRLVQETDYPDPLRKIRTRP